MRRRSAVVLVVIVAIAIAVTAATISRGGGRVEPSKPALHPPAASQRFGDNADLMHRLERKKLVKR